jgi:hypothetical protein
MGGLKGKAEGKAGATPDGSQGATTRHDIVRVGWVIDAVPPGKRAARKHQVINGGGTCSSKKPETTPHVEQRRARAAIKPFGPCSLVSSIDSAEFPWSQRVLLGFMILGRRTCGLWRDCSGEAFRRLRGRTTWPSCWRSSSPRGRLLVSNAGRSRMISRPGQQAVYFDCRNREKSWL